MREPCALIPQSSVSRAQQWEKGSRPSGEVSGGRAVIPVFEQEGSSPAPGDRTGTASRPQAFEPVEGARRVRLGTALEVLVGHKQGDGAQQAEDGSIP